MGKKVSKIGEENINTFGSKMIIKEHRKYSDIDVYFPEYNWTFKHATYQSFKKGKIKCPYEKRYFGVGYLGEGKYKVSENRKLTDEFKIWHGMLQRCYDPKYHEKEPTYKDCILEDYLLNFQHMAEWIDKNYYEVQGEQMHLDKDILCKGNKIYSPETCCFVPNEINTIFNKHKNKRCKLGVCGVFRKGNRFYSVVSMFGRNVSLGGYESIEEAKSAYKDARETYIKRVAEMWKEKLSTNVYNALINYEKADSIIKDNTLIKKTISFIIIKYKQR